MIYFNKYFKLPGPKDLGMSDSNYAMPTRLFPNNPTELSWEDYYERLAKMYPKKYFLAATLPSYILHIWRWISRPFKDSHYWFVSHFIPSRIYHWLDLRQPKKGAVNVDCYRYGWCDTDHKMEYAIINLFREFVEKRTSNLSWPSAEEAAKDDGTDYNYCGYKRTFDIHKEIMEIYDWITNKRELEIKIYYDKLSEWSKARHIWSNNVKELHQELTTIENNLA